MTISIFDVAPGYGIILYFAAYIAGLVIVAGLVTVAIVLIVKAIKKKKDKKED